MNSNENACGPSTRVANAIKSSIGSANRYPRMEYASLAERIASLHEVKPEEVVLGCGSTEILRMAAFAFLGSGKQLIQASPMLARAGASTTLVYIRNPNNPTASLTPRKDLEAFISKLPSSRFVVIDEAHHHYAGQSRHVCVLH